MSQNPFGREDAEPGEGERPSLFKDPASAGGQEQGGGPSLEKDTGAGGGWAPPRPGAGDTQPASGGWAPPGGGSVPPPGGPGQPGWPPPQQQPHPHQGYGQQPYPQQSPYGQQPYGQPGPVLQLASYGDRVAAALVDFLVRLGLILGGLLVGALLFVAGEAAGVVGLVVFGIAGFVASIAYAPYMMAKTNGQTFGHRTTNTRIVKADLGRMDGGSAVVREILVKWLLFEVVGGFFLIGTVINYLWAAWDPGNECLHDKICSTRVVRAD